MQTSAFRASSAFESGHPDKLKAFHEVEGFFVLFERELAHAKRKTKKPMFCQRAEKGF
jgi:hypothetical protein